MEETKKNGKRDRTSTASVQSRLDTRPIQNFPDYLRYVARRSKAGFDKVHEELYRIYQDSSSDKKNTDNNSETMKSLKSSMKFGRRERWSSSVKSGGLLWSSTGSVRAEASFTSYIAEDDTDVNNDKRVEKRNPEAVIVNTAEPHSASLVDKNKQEFKFDNFRYSTIIEDKCEDRRSKLEQSGEITRSGSLSHNNDFLKRRQANDDGYLPMSGKPYKPTQINKAGSRPMKIPVASEEEYMACDTHAEPDYQNVGKLSKRTPKKVFESEGDYMNAPRKPMRSVVGVSSFKTQEDDIYKVPMYAQDSAQPKTDTIRTTGNRYKTSTLEKSMSDPIIHDTIGDDYDVPPMSIRKVQPVAMVAQSLPDDIYQVPASLIREIERNHSPTETTEDDIYQVPQSNAIVKAASGGSRPYKNTDYKVPPSPIKKHTLNAVQSPSMNNTDEDEDDVYQVPPSEIRKVNTPEMTCDEVDEDDEIYQVPPSVLRKVGTGATSGPSPTAEEDDVYQVPPSTLRRVNIDDKKPEPTNNGSDNQVRPNDNQVRPSEVRQVKPTDTVTSRNERPLAAQRNTLKPAVKAKPSIPSKPSDSILKGEQGDKAESATDGEFFNYSVTEVVQCLNDNALTRLATICEEKQLNGDYFRELTNEDLKQEPFSMNWFYISKFRKVLSGWRAKRRV